MSNQHIVERDYMLAKQALLRRHDLDPDGIFDAETGSALLALDALYREALGYLPRRRRLVLAIGKTLESLGHRLVQ